MTRQDVYKSVDSEREFQIKMAGTAERPDILTDMSLGDCLGALKFNLDKAYDIWYYESPPYQKTMDIIRKIAALCVQHGEKYGMPKRPSHDK